MYSKGWRLQLAATSVLVASSVNISWAQSVEELKYSHIYALVVGINKYQHGFRSRTDDGWKKINNAQLDARRFSAVLQKQFGGTKQPVDLAQCVAIEPGFS